MIDLVESFLYISVNNIDFTLRIQFFSNEFDNTETVDRLVLNPYWNDVIKDLTDL